jgi:hyperosmotically inducible protein
MRIVAVLITVGLMATGCARETPPVEPQLTNEDLQEKVRLRLQSDTNVARLNLEVDADAEHNAVQLKGLAYTQRQRTQAVELARAAHPGVSVQDTIEVKPYEVPRDLFDDEMMSEERADAERTGDQLGTTLDDGWLHMKVVAKLIADSDTPQRDINVDVNEGVVTLRGAVKTRDSRTQAEAAAKSVEGVKSVRNRLVVQP